MKFTIKELLIVLVILLISQLCLSSCGDTTTKIVANETVERNYKVRMLNDNTITIVKSFEPKGTSCWVYTKEDTVYVSMYLHQIRRTPKAVKAIILDYL